MVVWCRLVLCCCAAIRVFGDLVLGLASRVGAFVITASPLNSLL